MSTAAERVARQPRVTQQELDRIVAAFGGARQVVDLYPLSPLQRGILFEALSAPGAGMYTIAAEWQIDGVFHISTLEAAWKLVVQRHSTLRTAFAGTLSSVPLQVVLREVPTVVDALDLREMSAVGQQAALLQHMQRERERPFDFANAPLARVSVLRLADASWRLIWSAHHSIIDGWSIYILFKEVIDIYARLANDEPLTLRSAKPYRDYIAWLQQQDLAAAQAYWRRRLAGSKAMPALTNVREGAAQSGMQMEYRHQLAVPLSRLTATASAHRVTTNALLLTAWAIVLSWCIEQDDVVLGVTVSGRPAELPDIESALGLFINTLPLRLRMDRTAPLRELIEQAQLRQAELLQYQYSPLNQVLEWSGLPPDQALFQSNVTYNNYGGPVPSGAPNPTGSRAGLVRSVERTSYPLNLAFMHAEQLVVRVLYDSTDFDETAIRQLLELLEGVLARIVVDAEPWTSERLAAELLPPGSVLLVGPKRAAVSSATADSGPAEKAPYVAPRTDLEAALATIWAEVLEVERIGIWDRFLDSGGNSLRAMLLVARVQDALGIELPLDEMLKAATVAEMAQKISLRQKLVEHADAAALDGELGAEEEGGIL